MLLVWKAQMGHRPDSRLLFRGHILHPVRLSCSFPWSNERDRVKSWHREREKLGEEAPPLFFISAHTSNKDIHHTRSHPHFTSSRSEPVAVALPVTGNRLKSARAEKNHDALPYLKTTARERARVRLCLYSEPCLWLSCRCWWQMEEARGHWSTLQRHIPSNNLHVPSISL